MTYEETIEYLFCKTTNFEQQGGSGYKPGMDSMLQLDAHFGHPHREFASIHVAGTNGKGSVSHTLAAVLQACGYRVGLYTSPHLVDFQERIRVNGMPIPHDYVVDFVETHREYFETVKPTFFEIVTALCFKYFSEQQVDVAVVEVGLGGRMDSTNIINPLLSIITNISLDHTQQLGATLAEIAWQKAGIIKHGVPCVVGEVRDETRPVFERVADEVGAPLIFAEDHAMVVAAEPLPGAMKYRLANGMELTGELLGVCQVKNTNTILCAVQQLLDLGVIKVDGEPAKDLISLQSVLSEAFLHVGSTTGLMGRWQVVGTNPTVVCDAGHNIGAWEYLGRQLESCNCKELHIVFGMMADKAVESVLRLVPRRAHFYWTKANTHRAMDEEKLMQTAAQQGLHGQCYPTVGQAFAAAIGNAGTSDLVFVGGSCYVVADFLKSLKEMPNHSI